MIINRIVLFSILILIVIPLNLFGDDIKWEVDLITSLEKASIGATLD